RSGPGRRTPRPRATARSRRRRRRQATGRRPARSGLLSRPNEQKTGSSRYSPLALTVTPHPTVPVASLLCLRDEQAVGEFLHLGVGDAVCRAVHFAALEFEQINRAITRECELRAGLSHRELHCLLAVLRRPAGCDRA